MHTQKTATCMTNIALEQEDNKAAAETILANLSTGVKMFLVNFPELSDHTSHLIVEVYRCEDVFGQFP